MTLIPNATTTPQLPATHTRTAEPRVATPQTSSPVARSHERAVPSAAGTPVVSAPKHAAAPKHTVDVKA
jgi:hypothetical protein